MKKSSWSVWCQGEDIEKVKKDQGRIENKESASSIDHWSDCIAQQERRLKETKD